MSNVDFVCSELRNNRFWKIRVNGNYLTTIEYTFEDDKKKLYVGISSNESLSDFERLKEVFFYCALGGSWSKLLRYYTEFFEFLFQKYQYTIVMSYRECIIKLEEEDFEIEKDLVKKIEDWLDNIIADFSKRIKLKKIIPILDEKEGGLEINDVKFLMSAYNGYIFEAKISSTNGDFYATVILLALCKNERVVRKSLEEFTKKCGRHGGKIFTSLGCIIQEKEENETIKFTYKFN